MLRWVQMFGAAVMLAAMFFSTYVVPMIDDFAPGGSAPRAAVADTAPVQPILSTVRLVESNPPLSIRVLNAAEVQARAEDHQKRADARLAENGELPAGAPEAQPSSGLAAGTTVCVAGCY